MIHWWIIKCYFFAIFLLVANLLVCSWVINIWNAHLIILEIMSTLVNYQMLFFLRSLWLTWLSLSGAGQFSMSSRGLCCTLLALSLPLFISSSTGVLESVPSSFGDDIDTVLLSEALTTIDSDSMNTVLLVSVKDCINKCSIII